TGLSIRKAQDRIQRSADTISKCFRRIVDALTSMPVYSAYIKLPKATDPTPAEIRDEPKLYPYFKNCLGALDGTHIYATIPLEDRPRFRNRK
ncbi:hypothetical protein DFH11DRAFT_1472496, partial [Phellopilus nigrolimitatus]